MFLFIPNGPGACPADRRRARLSVAGPDVRVVVFHHVDCRLLRAGGPAVDADVGGDEVGLGVWMGALVLGYQPARPGIRAVVEQEPVEVLVGFVVVVTVFGQVIIEVVGSVRLLLGEQLIKGLARGLLVGRRAELDPGRPPLRWDDSAVQGIVSGLTGFPCQGVSWLLYRVVLEVSGLVAALSWHLQLLSLAGNDEFAVVVSSYHASSGGIRLAGAAAAPVVSGYGDDAGFWRMNVTGQRGRRAACDPRGGLDQVVRRGASAARHRLVGAARDGARGARAERSGKDHGGPDPDHPATPRRGAGAGRGLRRGACGGRGAPVDRAGRSVGRHPGGAHRPGEPGDHRAAVPPELAAGPQSRHRAARAVRPERCRRPYGQDLLRRHAAAPGPGRQPGRPAEGAVPRRAHYRPGPAVAAGDVGHHPVAGGRRDHAPADDPVPG